MREPKEAPQLACRSLVIDVIGVTGDCAPDFGSCCACVSSLIGCRDVKEWPLSCRPYGECEERLAVLPSTIGSWPACLHQATTCSGNDVSTLRLCMQQRNVAVKSTNVIV